jgi:unsaturated chondroitin disaccharide hydrolase
MNLEHKLNRAFDFAESQTEKIIMKYPDQFPMYTTGGIWALGGEAWTNWCEGFLGGLMWLIYSRNKKQAWLERAEHYARLIEPRKYDRDVHDLGFLFWPTWKKWFDLTGDPSKQDVVVIAGQTMGKRFIDNGKYLRSFVREDSLFIDIMMNVGIVFYAAQVSDDPDLFNKADQHCRTTRRYLVRGDGSTAHEGLFNTETGEFLRQSTHQGWRGDSCWARGLAWAMYGFLTAYRFTDDPIYLDTSVACANFYLDNTSWDRDSEAGAGIPPNDYDDPGTPTQYESSAAAIAASALLDLSAAAAGNKRSDHYLEAGFTILETLSGPDYLAIDTDGWEGILKHGVYHNERGLGVDESVMWGDYFFIEAVDKALALLKD